MRRRFAAALVATGLLLSACGTSAETAPTHVTAAVQADGTFNETDVMFLQMMVAHHKQGLEMVRLAKKAATRPEVRTLAGAVDATQTDELELMLTWLKGWGEPTTVDHAPTAHADHGGLPATGPAELAALHKAKKAQFEPMFLNLFVAHQHNAVEMAHLETTDGVSVETKAFADRVRESRADQIRQMLTLMNT